MQTTKLHLSHQLQLVVCVLSSALLTACATGSPEAGSGVLDKALQAVGLQKPPIAESAKDLPALPLSRSVTLRLHAGEVLNTDPSGRSLSVIARVYKLKATDAFLQAPYEAFQAESSAKDGPFAKDVIEVREIVLTPGKLAEGVEKLGLDVNAVAVVALFRSPQPERWRFVFDAKAAAATGVTLGLHGCAMSVAQGQPVGAAPEALRVAGVRCQ